MVLESERSLPLTHVKTVLKGSSLWADQTLVGAASKESTVMRRVLPPANLPPLGSSRRLVMQELWLAPPGNTQLGASRPVLRALLASIASMMPTMAQLVAPLAIWVPHPQRVPRLARRAHHLRTLVTG